MKRRRRTEGLMEEINVEEGKFGKIWTGQWKTRFDHLGE